VHRRIARTIDEIACGNPALAGEVAHHADLGGDAPLAVRASLVAAQRCLRMFAGAEAARLADLGFARVDALPREERLPVQVALLEVLVYAGAPARRTKRIDLDLARTVAEAEGAGQSAIASRGLHALSVLQFDGGDLAGAHDSTIRAVGAVQGAESLVRARQLGESARCLATLERDVDRAQAMITEARSLETEARAELLEIRWGAATLDVFVGEYDKAETSLERALFLSRAAEDRWAEYECLRQLVQLDIETGSRTERCAELVAVASRMSEGSELPAARALEALERYVGDESDAEPSLERALEGLRSSDAKGMSAYVLIVAAEHDVVSGRLDAAERRAEEALALATTVNRRSQMALAHAVLGRVACARGNNRAAKRHLDAVHPDLERPLALSARARAAVETLGAAVLGGRNVTNHQWRRGG
jgi:tetratricopeptide (TPR) repeat protein